MFNSDFDPSRIRQCAIIEQDGKRMIQFYGIGDKHKMMRHDDGQIVMEKLPEQGNPFKYHEPYSIEDGLAVLDAGNFPTHQQIAADIRNDL